MDIPKKLIKKPETIIQSTDPTSKANEPITEQSGDNWHIGVFIHPVVKSRFSYQLTINRRVRINPSPIDDQYSSLFGCFSTPQEAIAAALEEVET